MKNTFKILSVVVIMVLLGLFVFDSCEKDELVEPVPSGTETPTAVNTGGEDNNISDGATVLGDKLENPYSVENMKKALEELQGSGMSSKSSIDISATHLYVRFLPKNEDELTVLKNDTTLDLFDYPLDYEIVENGTYYHDSSLPDTAIT